MQAIQIMYSATHKIKYVKILRFPVYADCRHGRSFRCPKNETSWRNTSFSKTFERKVRLEIVRDFADA